MHGKVRVDPTGGFIRIWFQEDATISDWREAGEMLGRVVQETAIRLTLVDLHKQESWAPIAELFDFGLTLPKDVRFAVLA